MLAPKVSIFIPVYNTEAYIAQTIACVLNQTFQDFELVIVDDASTDNTLAICESYAAKDARIRLYKNPKNLGMMPNWVHGIQFCKGTYWGKLDADDIWDPQFVEACVDVLDQQTDVGMVVCRYDCMDENDQPIPNSEIQFPAYARNKAFSMFEEKLSKGINGMFADGVTQQGIGLMRRSIFDDYGTFTLLPAGDSEMWFRIGAHYKIYGIDACWHHHRIWSSSFTRTQVNKAHVFAKNLFDARQHILDYYLKVGLLNGADYNVMRKENELSYGFVQAAHFRQNKDWSQFIGQLGQLLKLDPKATLSFYSKRLFNR